jgi:hypothetical protein
LEAVCFRHPGQIETIGTSTTKIEETMTMTGTAENVITKEGEEDMITIELVITTEALA